jgi:hypothetical protein
MPSADIARVLSHLGLLRSGILGACVTEAWWCVVPSQQICRRIVINEIGCGRVQGSPGAGQPRRDEAKFLNESLILIAIHSQHQWRRRDPGLVRIVL